MKIQHITNRNQNINFNARLFNYDGTEITRFPISSELCVQLPMNLRGNEHTRIYVEDFTKSPKYECYHRNFILFNVSNPLFGEGNRLGFEVPPESPSLNLNDKPIKGNKAAELHALDILTGQKTNFCTVLENNALKQFLIKSILSFKENGDPLDLNPIYILEKRFSTFNPTGLGFSNSRIAKFREIAQELTFQLVFEGTTTKSLGKILQKGVQNLAKKGFNI